MAVSTDGVMLGAWADLQDATNLLDIGTGTGLLALMAAQRNANAQITALDIDAQAIAAASDNISHSPWSGRITLQQCDATQAYFPPVFERIICNPPYFLSGVTAQRPERALARHCHHLSHDTLLANCAAWLTENGHASLILPVVEGQAFIVKAAQYGLFLRRLCQVKPTANKAANRLLFELAKAPQQCEETALIIRENGEYSAEFTALTKDFYLKM